MYVSETIQQPLNRTIVAGVVLLTSVIAAQEWPVSSPLHPLLPLQRLRTGRRRGGGGSRPVYQPQVSAPAAVMPCGADSCRHVYLDPSLALTTATGGRASAFSN